MRNMKECGFRLRAARGPFSDQIDILLVEFDLEGQRWDFVKSETGALIPADPVASGANVSPTLSVDPETAQQLIDDLWHAGLRPTQGKQSEGQMSAMAAHLLDMRTIAFNSLHLENPQ